MGGRHVRTVMAGLLTAFACAAVGLAQPASAADYWSAMAVATDEFGHQVPIRFGSKDLGFTKACDKHNLCNLTYMQATIAAPGNGSDEGGGRFKYRAYLVGGNVGVVELVVIGDQNRRTQVGNSPDALPVGVITAYCTGMLRCPDDVNLGA